MPSSSGEPRLPEPPRAKEAAKVNARHSLVEFVNEYGARGSEIALVCHRGYRMERWTYARILEEACRFARELEGRGIGKGEAVVLWGAPSAEWVIAFFGCVLRGAVAVPIDHISTGEFASRIARETHAKLIVRSHAVAEVESTVPSLILETLTETVSRRAPEPYLSPARTREDTLEIIFTSGATAEPRGVVISHGNVLANIEPLEREIKKYLRYERFVHPVRFLNLLPMSHIFGQIMGLFIPPLLGGTVIFMDSLKPPDVMEMIQRERVSVLITVPRLIESLQRRVEQDLEQEGRLEKFRKHFAASEKEHFLRRWWRFRSVHGRFGWKFWAFISGGATLPEKVESFWNRLGYAVIQGYGMTETTSLITLNHPFKIGRGSIGKTFPGVEIKVAEDGEILVRGENIAKAYQRGEKLTPLVDPDGWLHTGDLAEMGADGRLYFRGRRKNVIVTPAGMKVYPEDLEAALRQQKGVRDCVVVGLDFDGNEEPCAVLLLEDKQADGTTVVESANASLAEYQQIRHWFAWPEPDFPRTPTQKPSLARIREVANARMGARRPAPYESSVAALVARVTGRPLAAVPPAAGLEAQLSLTSLDRVELMSAMEDRYQVDLSEAKFSQASTIGQLEQLVREPQFARAEHVYPRWPQRRLTTFIRMAVYYLLTWPATYLLAAPRIKGRENLRGLRGPMLVVSNHVTYVDIGWILAALPARFRHRLATAMRGERLAEMRHPGASLPWFTRLTEHVSYFLVLGLFNVFPLPKESGFLRSFSFVGDLVDRGWNILIFPEGLTTQDGRIAPFRSGIGLLATRLNIPVVPIRLDGLFELKKESRILARPGQVRVTIGKPVRFSPDQDPNEIARELQRRVAEL